jgi:hypothetical protein
VGGLKELRYRFTGEDASLGRTMDGLGDGADRAGGKLHGMADEAKLLDQQIDETKGRIRGLAAELARAERGSDTFKQLAKDFGAANRELGLLTKIRKSMESGGDQAGRGFIAKFTSAIGQGSAAIGPLKTVLVAGAVGAAPVIASTVAGAVTAGVALAGVGAGLAVAFHDEEVLAAAGELGELVHHTLQGAARPFINETIAGIGIIRGEVQNLRPDIDALFAVSSTRVQPLARAAAGALHELVPALREANDNAEPLADMLEQRIPEAAGTAGDALRLLSKDSENSANALGGLLAAAEMSIGGTATLLAGLNKIGPFVSAPIYALGDATKKTGEQAAAAGPSINGFTGWTGRAGEVAGKSAWQMKSLADQMAEVADTALSAFNSETRLEQAIDDATAAARENGHTLDVNTAKGRNNRNALAQLAEQTMATRDATLAQTHSASAAEAVMQRGYNAFIKAARGMGVSKREADALARSLGLIPPAKNVTVTAHTGAAQAAVRALQSKINDLKSKHIYVEGTVRWTSSGLHVPGGTITERAEGGPISRHTPYLVGERGPELVVPRQDGVVVPAGETRRLLTGGGPSSGGAWGGGDVERAVERGIVAGMRRVAVLVDGRRAGQIEARRADRLMAGG